ncbi:MAG TPA: type III pantothenate kinase [Caldilineae bacterium]|nr:type III pantothenate kinase [Caldilineae bacterium]
MLLAIDVGNTNIVFGLFQQDALAHHWRMASRLDATADELGVFLTSAARRAGVTLPRDLEGVIIGSVAPPLTAALVRMSRAWLGLEPRIMHVSLLADMPVRVKEPERVGADRLLNAYAARAAFGAPVIALDFGTATKFDVVGPEGDFLGGAIAPGFRTASDALVSKTALLPRIDLAAPPAAIGDDTITAMQSGIVLGYVSLVEGLLKRIQAALAPYKPLVVATGGLADAILPHTHAIDRHDPHLTLHGLRLVFAQNVRDVEKFCNQSI